MHVQGRCSGGFSIACAPGYKFMVLIAVVARPWGFVNTTMERGGIHLVLLNL